MGTCRRTIACSLAWVEGGAYAEDYGEGVQSKAMPAAVDAK